MSISVYLLQVQALIDIAVKAAAALGLGVEGYIDAGNKLKSAGILSDEEFRRYRTVVRFRNIVVHQYDIEIIRRIIERREYRDVARMGIKIVEEVRRRTRKN
ncbi:MAG: HepT-like ribonuclease domain-containing protein [Pyrobaculum sp.]